MRYLHHGGVYPVYGVQPSIAIERGGHLWLAVGTIIHTISQQNYHADYYYADNVFEPQMTRYCGAAFDVKPGARVMQDSQCTPDSQLFFQLGSAVDPLAVSWEGRRPTHAKLV